MFKNFQILGVIAVSISLCFIVSDTHAQTVDVCTHFETHIVKEGETLDTIARAYGDERFRDAIYLANTTNVDNLHNLTPGHQLRIPIRIAEYKEAKLTFDEVLTAPCLPGILQEFDISEFEADPTKADTANTDNDALLDEFRRAFESLMAAEADTVTDNGHLEAEQQILSGMGGMVIDETRSKIGRDFYDLFFQGWQAPPQVARFTITISEQPAPGLGTIISVRANDTETFRHRLQPRYEAIQEATRFAVRITYNHLEQNPQDFIIY